MFKWGGRSRRRRTARFGFSGHGRSGGCADGHFINGLPIRDTQLPLPWAPAPALRRPVDDGPRQAQPSRRLARLS